MWIAKSKIKKNILALLMVFGCHLRIMIIYYLLELLMSVRSIIIINNTKLLTIKCDKYKNNKY